MATPRNGLRVVSTRIANNIMTEPQIRGELRPSNIAVIKEVYDSENALARFELELETALDVGCTIIVIEPERLGEETTHWIAIGNVLNKISIGSGLISIVTGIMCKPLICIPFGVLSVLSTSCYTLSWQWDPCCKYQQEKNPKRLSHISVLSELNSASPVVLVRTDNRKMIIGHCTVSIAAALVCLLRIYKVFK